MSKLFKKASFSETPPPPPPARPAVAPDQNAARKAEWQEWTSVPDEGLGQVSAVTKQMYMKAISKRMDTGELKRGGE